MSLLLAAGGGGGGGGAISGTAAMQSGALRGSGTLAASVPLTFGQSASLRGSGALAGASPIVFDASATPDGGAPPATPADQFFRRRMMLRRGR